MKKASTQARVATPTIFRELPEPWLSTPKIKPSPSSTDVLIYTTGSSARRSRTALPCATESSSARHKQS
jgi:hypothetical protein